VTDADDWAIRLEVQEDRSRRRHLDRVADMVPPECDCAWCTEPAPTVSGDRASVVDEAGTNQCALVRTN
jgi:hypothetical protein